MLSGEAGGGEGRWQHGQPQRLRWRDAGLGGCGAARLDERSQITGRGIVHDRAGSRVGAEGGRLHRDRRASGRTGPACEGDLQLDEVAGATAEEGTASLATVEAGRCRGADHVDGVGLVGHAQAASHRAVRANRGADDASRSLSGQHEVHAEAAAARRQLHEVVEEGRQLDRQRRQLVDDDDHPRKRLDPR